MARSACNYPVIKLPQPPDLLGAILALLPKPPAFPTIALPGLPCPLDD
jgi:hypothetical protein